MRFSASKSVVSFSAIASLISSNRGAGHCNTYKSYTSEVAMRSIHSMVISMRLPAESGKRLKRMANRHGWTPRDTSARLVEVA
jgi:hypothetical protein